MKCNFWHRQTLVSVIWTVDTRCLIVFQRSRWRWHDESRPHEVFWCRLSCSAVMFNLEGGVRSFLKTIISWYLSGVLRTILGFFSHLQSLKLWNKEINLTSTEIFKKKTWNKISCVYRSDTVWHVSVQWPLHAASNACKTPLQLTCMYNVKGQCVAMVKLEHRAYSGVLFL